MKEETLEIMIINYRKIKEICDEVNEPRVFNIVISEEEYIKNVKKIDSIYKDFWDKDIDNELIEIIQQLGNISYSNKKIKSQIVYLKDIVGVVCHPNYSFLRWIMALPLLKRLDNNFPKNENEKNDLFNKMKNNDFFERIKLVKKDDKYYIDEGHHRVIICKALGLDYLKADVVEVE